MERNVVIATVLVALILFVWFTFVAPPPQTVPQPDDPRVDTVQVEALDTAAASPRSLTDVLETPSGDSALAALSAAPGRTITVENDLYTARFSTRGATLVDFKLKKYNKFDQKTPVQLVSKENAGAMGLVFTTANNHVIDSRALVFEASSPDSVITVGAQGAQLAFEARVGGGVLRQTYTFKPETYEVDLNVTAPGGAFSTSGGYELVWYGGIPYTEDNLEDEARHAGAYARSGGSVEYIDLNKNADDVQRLSGEVTWVSVKNKYFTAVVMPQTATRGAELEGEKTGDVEGGSLWKDFAARVLMPPADAKGHAYTFYIGPLEYFRITDYGVGLYDMVDYGYDFFEWITRPLAKFVFIPVFTFLGKVLPNYGLVIIVFSILIKLVLWPLTRSSYTSMARMRDLQPKMEAIKEKYADNPQKQQEAVVKLYKEGNINPLGGCLPMLAQWPVLIALYQFFPQSLELRQASFLWANDLSAPDAILHLPFKIPFYGDFVAGFTLFMGLSMIIQMRMQAQPSANPQAKIMTYTFPVMIFMLFNRLSSGLSLYYLVFNILSVAQQKLIDRKAKTAAPAEADPAPVRPVRSPSTKAAQERKAGRQR